MIIIGEKINGTLKKTAAAIANREPAYIQELARSQAAAGADYLDVNAGTLAQSENEDLIWLVETVQAITDVPLCLDSSNPAALAAAIPHVRHLGIINSISGEQKRLEGILPLVQQHGCKVIALLLDENGIPETAEERLDVGRAILVRTRRAGIRDEDVFLDPLALSLATHHDSGLIAMDTMRRLRARVPTGTLQLRFEQRLLWPAGPSTDPPRLLDADARCRVGRGHPGPPRCGSARRHLRR